MLLPGSRPREGALTAFYIERSRATLATQVALRVGGDGVPTRRPPGAGADFGLPPIRWRRAEPHHHAGRPSASGRQRLRRDRAAVISGVGVLVLLLVLVTVPFAAPHPGLGTRARHDRRPLAVAAIAWLVWLRGQSRYR